MSRHLHIERRLRLDALHRQERQFDHDEPRVVARGGRVVEHDRNAGPLTLDAALAEAVRRRGWTSPSHYLMTLAKGHAVAAAYREPNIRVLASYAAERASNEMMFGLPFDHASPDFFKNGFAYRQQQVPGLDRTHRWDTPDEDGASEAWDGLARRDLAALRMLSTDWTTAVRSGCIPADWSPTYKTAIWEHDPLRPPAEALALVATGLRLHWSGTAELLDLQSELLLFSEDLGDQVQRNILMLGLGLAGAAEALSVMIPNAAIWCGKRPFAPTRLPAHRWDAVILGLPTARAWGVAELLGAPARPGVPPHPTYRQRRKILRGQIKDSYAHFEGLLRIALRHGVSGSALILVGDPEEHAAISQALREQRLLEPLVLDGLDTSARAIWCGYVTAQRGSSGLPAATGKVISFWRWT